MNTRDLVKASKFMSLVLRHQPELIGLSLDENGWAEVDELIVKSAGFADLTRAIVEEVVATNDKKRFAFSDDGWRIRASQGHSIKVDLELKPALPPQHLYHGTGFKSVNAIKTDGLKKMSRNHVHLSNSFEQAKKVGSRHGSPFVLKVDSGQMDKDGFKFYLSDNDVWLTDEVPVKYIDFSLPQVYSK